MTLQTILDKRELTYPAEFLRSVDEKYSPAEILKLNLPIALVGMFGAEFRIRLITPDFLEFGNIIPYIKITKASTIAKYMIDLTEYSLTADSDIMICALPAGGSESFALGELCDNYVNIPGLIKNLLAGINSISANERTCVLALERIFEHVKRNRVISSKIKQVSIRSLINKRFTRYGVPQSIEDEKSKEKRSIKKKQFKTILNNIQDLMPQRLVEQGGSGPISTLSDKMRQWSSYKGISGDCPIDTDENTQIIENLLRLIEDCVCSPTNVLLSIPKVIELLKYLLSDKHFCYTSFKSNMVRTRLNVLSKYSSDFQNEMEQMSVEALKIIVNDEIKSISVKRTPKPAKEDSPEFKDTEKVLDEVTENTNSEEHPKTRMEQPYHERIIFNPKTVFNVTELNYTRVNAEKAIGRLKKYVGQYIDELDLTKSFITGSGIAYSVSPFDEQGEFPCTYTEPIDWKGYKEIMNKVYEICMNGKFVCNPIVKLEQGNTVSVTLNCVPSGQPARNDRKSEARSRPRRTYGRRGRESMMNDVDESDVKNDNKSESKVVEADPSAILFKFEMNLISGADIDMGIETESVEEFDTIVQKHYTIVKKYHPHAKLRKEERSKKYYYQIYTDDPDYIVGFRKIDMFMSTRKEVLTWHLYPVRGMYTVMNGILSLYLSASCIYGITNHDMDYFCYFKSKIQSPEEIVLKYLQRGFYISVPRNIIDDLNEYVRNNERWNHVESMHKLITHYFDYPKYMHGNFNLFDINGKTYTDGCWRTVT